MIIPGRMRQIDAGQRVIPPRRIQLKVEDTVLKPVEDINDRGKKPPRNHTHLSDEPPKHHRPKRPPRQPLRTHENRPDIGNSLQTRHTDDTRERGRQPPHEHGNSKTPSSSSSSSSGKSTLTPQSTSLTPKRLLQLSSSIQRPTNPHRQRHTRIQSPQLPPSPLNNRRTKRNHTPRTHKKPPFRNTEERRSNRQATQTIPHHQN